MERLKPVDKPRGVLLRIAYAITARQFGKVISPMRVIYARKPRLLRIALQISRTLDSGLSIDPALRLLIQVQASRSNGCAFCEDLALAQSVRHRVGADRFVALEEFRTSDLFTARERAALSFTEEAIGRKVGDETFAELRKHFSEAEIVELTWVVAAETYFNVQSHALGLESDELLNIAMKKK